MVLSSLYEMSQALAAADAARDGALAANLSAAEADAAGLVDLILYITMQQADASRLARHARNASWQELSVS